VAAQPKKNFKILFSLLFKKLKHPTHKPIMQTVDTFGHDKRKTEKKPEPLTRVTVAQPSLYKAGFWAKMPAVATFAAF
jgi:hypothetical protein